MIPEVKVLQHVYHIVGRVGLQVLFPEMIQNLDFDQGLMMESLLVPVIRRARDMINAFVERKEKKYMPIDRRLRYTDLMILIAMC